MWYVNARFLTQRITGSQRYCIEIARNLRRRDSSIRFLTPRDVRHEEIANELGADVVGSRTGVLWEQLDLPRYLKRNGSPLLVSMQYTAPMLYTRSIVTIHDVVFRNPQWVSRSFHYWYRFLIPRVVARARRVVTVSEFSKKEIVETLGVPSKKIVVVYGAASESFSQLAASVGENEFGRYVLGVATLSKRKNFNGLIRAFLGTADKSVKLILVGGFDAAVYGRDAELSKLLGSERIVLAGYVSDEQLARLYKHAQIFVFPSFYEGFGIPPIEAMSVGCPVITSNVASLPEVCGEAARFVDPSDERALTVALDDLLSDSDSRAELRERGRVQAARYNWQRSAVRFAEIAEEVETELKQD